jgi:hypothetical protein
LVQNGQWEFINGGWVQHDEANSSDEAQIIQMARGHKFLLEEFGVRPTVGAQYDPFGHSTTSAHLNAKMGFTSLFFARVDYQDYNYRLPRSQLEMIWKPSVSENTEIFTHVFWDATYCQPRGFDFEDRTNDPIQNDPKIFNYNIEARCDEFAALMRERAASYQTPEILAMMGCDFKYQNARIQYKNLDKMIEYINSNPEKYSGMKLKYSTPGRYFEAVKKYPIDWPVKRDDFFPIAFAPHSFWAGYFTSRPALKGYIRTRKAILQSVNKFAASISGNLVAITPEDLAQIDVLTQAFSVTQHHDSVTGTSKQHVTDDYALRLSIGTDSALGVFNSVLKAVVDQRTEFSFCPHLNMSVCPGSTDPLASGLSVPVVVYNSLGWSRREVLFIPVGVPSVTVRDASAKVLPSSILQRDGTTVVAFEVDLPPLGFTSCVISPGSEISENVPVTSGASISNEFYKIDFDPNSGKISRINGQIFSLDYFWYNSSIGNGPGPLAQASGAYMLRPNKTDPYLVSPTATTNIEISGIFQQASMIFTKWVRSVVRLYPGKKFIEVESTVGPIPIDDGLGKEVIVRFTTPIDNQRTWYTDANGEQMQERKLNYRDTWPLEVNEPVACNYFPMTFSGYIQNGTQQLAVVTDRARGCSSLNPGQLETMLHRRCLYDDHQGVGEPLNETEAIRTIERVTLGNPTDASYRPNALILNSFLHVAFGTPVKDPIAWLTSVKTSRFSGLLSPLPPNVHLMTYEPELGKTGKFSAVARFQHIFGVAENPVLSQPAMFSLDSMFTGRKLANVSELSLSGNQVVDHVLPPFMVTLLPLQIRTFLLEFE